MFAPLGLLLNVANGHISEPNYGTIHFLPACLRRTASRPFWRTSVKERSIVGPLAAAMRFCSSEWSRRHCAALAWLRSASPADRYYVVEATTKKQDQEK